MADLTGTSLTQRERDIMDAILAAVADELKRRDQRFAEIESAQQKTLADHYRGGFMPNTDYRRGDVIADRNSLWVCMSATEERPGSTSAWKLIMKAPR